MPAARILVALVLVACSNPGATQSPPNASDSTRLGATPVALSNDAQPEPVVRRCLADDTGEVSRLNDNEAYVAVDPRDPDRVIAVWQTLSAAGSVIQWARSSDGGTTWSAPRAAPINACAGGPAVDALRASDPWAAFGPDGRAYLSAIAWRPDPNNGPDLVSTLVVVASPDGGLTWESPVTVARAPSIEISHDNLAITADPTRAGTIYAATTRAEAKGNESYFGRLGFTRSEDGGKTWTPIRPITDAVNSERIGAPQVVVDPRSGRMYAVYHRSRRGTESVIGVMTSNDRGATWSSEIVAARYVPGPQVQHPATGRPFELATDIVQATVSPVSGRIAIAYADARRDPGRRGDVSLVWSVNGTTWSQPIAASDKSLETAWLPGIAYEPNGDAAVSYFSADFAAGQATPRIRLLLQRFKSTATGFTVGEKVVLDTASLQWPGDYHGLVSVRHGFLAAYGRQQDIAAAVSPGGAR